MQPLSQALTMNEQDGLPDAYMRLLETDLRPALVLRGSRLIGVLSLSDVERLVEARRASQPGAQRRMGTRGLTTPEP
jgi:CBS domain-containing protein